LYLDITSLFNNHRIITKWQFQISNQKPNPNSPLSLKLNLSLFRKSFKLYPTAPENSPSPLSRTHHHNHNGGRAQKQSTTAGTSNPLQTGCREGNCSSDFNNDVTTKYRDRCSFGASSEAEASSECSPGGDRRPTHLRARPRLAHVPLTHAAMELADFEGIFQNLEGALRDEPRELEREERIVTKFSNSLLEDKIWNSILSTN